MNKTPEKPAFLGTYFDRDSVLRWERWTRIVAWVIFAVYVIQYVYDTGMNIYNSFAVGYPLDWVYMVFSMGRPFQGAMILVVLHLLAKGLLILLDIEDNTRRAARK
ncbi:MAG: hypothetical protein L6461_14275 [Anaerolineae bacterium]|nr:hypothetical protein [Anaerolineae bacterium]